ncbi:MAG: FMN-binding protein [Promicromonosporaceae bacterium]|nr:FMN-binding protein [Promicromonosporaceae bacterium]
MERKKLAAYAGLTVLSAGVLTGAAVIGERPTTPPFSAVAPPAAEPSLALQDGVFTGEVGLLGTRVTITVEQGRIVDVTAVYRTDNRHSRAINGRAITELINHTIETQGDEVQLVTGATFTTEGYRHSLQSALDGARR